MDTLDSYAGDTHRPNEADSMLPFLVAGAPLLVGFFVWATLLLSRL